MAVFAPIPSASVKIAVSPNPQLFRSVRTANRTSCSKDSTRECSVCASARAPLAECAAAGAALPECAAAERASVDAGLAACGSAREGSVGASARVAAGCAPWRCLVFEPVLEGWSCRAMRACPKYKNATGRTISHYLTFWYHPWVWLVRFGYWTNLYEFDVLVRFPCFRKVAFLASDFDFWLCVVILGRRSGRGCRAGRG